MITPRSTRENLITPAPRQATSTSKPRRRLPASGRCRRAALEGRP
ncbi:unnamed protein product [Pylaiella littoralis]